MKNVWEPGSKWRSRLTTSWLALGWIIALVLLATRGIPLHAARAAQGEAGGTTKCYTPSFKSGYSAIGLKFETVNQGGLRSKTSVAPYQAIPISGIYLVGGGKAPAGYIPFFRIPKACVIGTDDHGKTRGQGGMDEDFGGELYVFVKIP